ncbi:hypothetical protein R0135_09720 [Congregibacter variabilis]|uniref:Uncharacterized protein n=1 Tax=Congregibacter variabilis TaxID=3081200 RepID=A0ABZ0HZU4_9GAMM|nr:hypothetical protein R0135_09720 [Congregibacter sp. IMCC43200]
MLLRRITEHTKTQNWFAVGIDFVVVVLGIFIGLQVSDWNQARLDGREAAYHLGFLYEELLEEIIVSEEEIKRSRLIAYNSFDASTLLVKDDWEPEDEEKFKELVYSTFQLWGPKSRPVSLRRMIDDGKLDLVKSKQLQKAILDFESAYLDAIDQTETSYSYSLQVTPAITASMKFVGPKIVSTAQELRSNYALRAAVRDKAIWQRVQLEVLDDLQGARNTLRDVLAEHLQ